MNQDEYRRNSWTILFIVAQMILVAAYIVFFFGNWTIALCAALLPLLEWPEGM